MRNQRRGALTRNTEDSENAVPTRFSASNLLPSVPTIGQPAPGQAQGPRPSPRRPLPLRLRSNIMHTVWICFLGKYDVER